MIFEQESLFGGFDFGAALFGGGAASAVVVLPPDIVPMCVSGVWPTYAIAGVWPTQAVSGTWPEYELSIDADC